MPKRGLLIFSNFSNAQERGRQKVHCVSFKEYKSSHGCPILIDGVFCVMIFGLFAPNMYYVLVLPEHNGNHMNFTWTHLAWETAATPWPASPAWWKCCSSSFSLGHGRLQTSPLRSCPQRTQSDLKTNFKPWKSFEKRNFSKNFNLAFLVLHTCLKSLYSIFPCGLPDFWLVILWETLE